MTVQCSGHAAPPSEKAEQRQLTLRLWLATKKRHTLARRRKRTLQSRLLQTQPRAAQCSHSTQWRCKCGAGRAASCGTPVGMLQLSQQRRQQLLWPIASKQLLLLQPKQLTRLCIGRGVTVGLLCMGSLTQCKRLCIIGIPNHTQGVQAAVSRTGVACWCFVTWHVVSCHTDVTLMSHAAPRSQS
jgi:hypothetical protein